MTQEREQLPDPSLERTVELVRAAKRGEQVAFQELYERHYERVRRSAALRMGSTLKQCEQDIEDVVQESFVYAFERLATGRFDEARSEGGFRNWLAKHIVESKVRDAARRKNAQKRGGGRQQLMRDTFGSAIEPPVAAQTPTPSEVLRGREVSEDVESAILQLSDRHRRVLDLRDHCAMRFEEIAAEMGFQKAVTVRSLYHRAREELKALLEPKLRDWDSYFDRR